MCVLFDMSGSSNEVTALLLPGFSYGILNDRRRIALALQVRSELLAVGCEILFFRAYSFKAQGLTIWNGGLAVFCVAAVEVQVVVPIGRFLVDSC